MASQLLLLLHLLAVGLQVLVQLAALPLLLLDEVLAMVVQEDVAVQLSLQVLMAASDLGHGQQH